MGSEIGIFGGAFNPPTTAHVALAEAAVALLALDRLWVVPTGSPVHKTLESDPGPQRRLALCRAAFEHVPQIQVNDYELASDSPSETYLTIRALEPRTHPWLILGADQAATLPEWGQSEEIAAHARIAIIGRPGTDRAFVDAQLDCIAAQRRWLEVVVGDVSSTRVRAALTCGADVSCDLPEPVTAMIMRFGLYSPNRFANAPQMGAS